MRLAGVAAQAGSGEIASPDPSIRWRLTGTRVERTSDGGASWALVPTGATEPLAAGSAPTATVCWLVGRGGAVFITTDGRQWARIAFPEAVDSVAIRATDARSASVTTADGRTFRTTDGGVTWAAD